MFASPYRFIPNIWFVARLGDAHRERKEVEGLSVVAVLSGPFHIHKKKTHRGETWPLPFSSKPSQIISPSGQASSGTKYLKYLKDYQKKKVPTLLNYHQLYLASSILYSITFLLEPRKLRLVFLIRLPNFIYLTSWCCGLLFLPASHLSQSVVREKGHGAVRLDPRKIDTFFLPVGLNFWCWVGLVNNKALSSISTHSLTPFVSLKPIPMWQQAAMIF